MIKRNQDHLNRISAILDFLLVVLAYVFSAWFRLKVLHGWWENKGLSRQMIIASLFYAAGLLFMLSILGFYGTTRVKKLSWKLGILFLATTVTIFTVTALIFIFKIEDISRGIILIFYFLTLFLLGGKTVATRLILNQIRSSGYNIKHEVLVGNGRLAKQYQEDIGNEPELGIQIDKIISPDDDLEACLSSSHIDEVVIALEPENYNNVTRLISSCEKAGIRYYIVPFYNDMIPAHPIFETIGKTRLVNMRANRQEQIGWVVVKRVFDVVLSALGLILLSPLMLLISIGVKVSSPGPVLFRQERVGFNRKKFLMLKFRSMYINQEADTTWSKKNDNRRTAFGSFIRKFSLDELPQLINVLRGDMSLVGPRPELPYFVEKFKEEIPLYMVKHQVKPGITGWAQVNGYRGDTSIKKRIELDLWYIDNWSPLLDLKILFMTVPWAMINDERLGDIPESDVKIIVCTHKPYWMPSDPLYIPLQVGAEGKDKFPGFVGDNTGENISLRNANYCELTGLYWAWKNLKCDYLGLAHYRRHFTLLGGTSDRRDALSLDQARSLLVSVDVLLPKKRNYWIETNYQQYVHAHHAIDLDETRVIISEKCPEYLKAYDKSMKRTTGHRFNMFIMKKSIADEYCEWLFDILFELEKRLDISDYSTNDKRVFGFVSERLLDVWLETNKIQYKDIPYIFLEKENWITKGINFILRKIEGKKK
ncbi:MAG: undecaprenyl-phosphate glucose phosphotransferase [Blautia sp.]|nr:undecaprenyl-phosphate glucose phosphotransferase [Blautia sp.]